MVVENGHATEFWIDRWLNGTIFRDKYPSHYNVAINKRLQVCDACSEEGEGRVWWCDSNSGESLNQNAFYDLVQELDIVVWQGHVSNRWRWRGFDSGDYTVSLVDKLTPIAAPDNLLW